MYRESCRIKSSAENLNHTYIYIENNSSNLSVKSQRMAMNITVRYIVYIIIQICHRRNPKYMVKQ